METAGILPQDFGAKLTPLEQLQVIVVAKQHVSYSLNTRMQIASKMMEATAADGSDEVLRLSDDGLGYSAESSEESGSRCKELVKVTRDGKFVLKKIVCQASFSENSDIEEFGTTIARFANRGLQAMHNVLRFAWPPGSLRITASASSMLRKHLKQDIHRRCFVQEVDVARTVRHSSIGKPLKHGDVRELEPMDFEMARGLVTPIVREMICEFSSYFTQDAETLC